MLQFESSFGILSCRTVCVSGGWAGVETIQKREKLKAWKLLVKRAESRPAAARFVGRLCELWTC